MRGSPALAEQADWIGETQNFALGWIGCILVWVVLSPLRFVAYE